MQQEIVVTRYRWRVGIIIFLANLLTRADSANIGVALPFIMREIPMGNAWAGMLASLFFLGFSSGQFAGGFIVRKLGTRGVGALGILVYSAFTGLIGTARSYWPIGLYRVSVGLAEGPVTISMLTTLNNWFPGAEKARASNFYFVPATLAVAIVGPIATAVALQWGWPAIFYVFALPGLLTAFLWWRCIRTYPEEHPAAQGNPSPSSPAVFRISEREPDSQARTLASVSGLLGDGTVVGVWLAWFCFNCIFHGLVVWIPAYLVRERGVSFQQMGWMTGLLWTGGVAGMLLGSWLCDVVFGKRRKPAILISNFVCGILFLIIAFGRTPVAVSVAALFVAGFFLNLSVPSYGTYLMGLTRREIFPVAMGVMGTLGNLAGFLSPPFFGLLVDWSGGYSGAFVFLVVCSLASLGIISVIRESSV